MKLKDQFSARPFLSFVPVDKNTDEFQVKADCENFYRRLRLKAHFFDEDKEGRNANDGDSSKVSSWTPPEGKFSALDHYIDLCRRQVSRSNFKKRAAYSNLSLGEKQALDRLSKRDDIVIKPVDKGGAVVVHGHTQ